MSITECMTMMSRVPMSGPKCRSPEAMGVTMILGMPIGSAFIAAAPSTAPSAPPRQSTPGDAALREEVQRHLRARRPSSVRPPPRACPPFRSASMVEPGGLRHLCAA